MIKIELLEFEDFLIRHPVLDKLKKNKPMDWFISKGYKFLKVSIFDVGFTFSVFNDSPEEVKKSLIEARDSTVQQTKETEHAARIRDILVRSLYSDRQWDALVELCSLPQTEGKERQLTFKLENTLRGL